MAGIVKQAEAARGKLREAISLARAAVEILRSVGLETAADAITESADDMSEEAAMLTAVIGSKGKE